MNYGLGLDPARLYVTVFAGNESVPRDLEAVEIWKRYIPEHRIYLRGSKDNWWTAGPDSPSGPSTEMFYDLTGTLGDLSPEQFEQADEKQELVEIWNDVFMMYRQEAGVIVGTLPQKNVDTGSGLERICAVVQGKKSIFETDAFMPLFETMQKLGASVVTEQQFRSARILADHSKAIAFLLSENVQPSNTDRGYIVRRLARRALLQTSFLDLEHSSLIELSLVAIKMYEDIYPHMKNKDSHVTQSLTEEIEKFKRVIQRGRDEFKHYAIQPTFILTGEFLAELSQTHGLPLELSLALAQEYNIQINENALDVFDRITKSHQMLSRHSAIQKFAGGLSDHFPETVRLHTAHHLLLSALGHVLGSHVKQRGSNITPERLRLDITHDQKMTDDEKMKVEKLVNSWIQSPCKITHAVMKKSEAEKIGAQMEFGTKYGEDVSVYMISLSDGTNISKEFCGGPHVDTTAGMGTFRLQKEESSSSGIRRIKASLE